MSLELTHKPTSVQAGATRQQFAKPTLTHIFVAMWCHYATIHFTAPRSRTQRPPILRMGNTLLPVDESTKFLGLWWDSHLSFKKHISVLKTQCKEAFNLIRVVAHLKWGGDRDTLLMLYRAIVRSMFDYGSIAYGTASNTNLRQLDSIHNSGLRLALGAFCTSLGPPKKFQHLTRAEEVVITRLRIGHTKATKSHILSRGPPTGCHQCGQTLTIDHMLLQCALLQECRDENYTVDSLNALFKTIPETCIEEFLREAGFFYLIWCNLLTSTSPQTWTIWSDLSNCLVNESNSETH